MANFIQNFRSTDVGAPVLTGQVGSGVALLLACLVNGYATLSVTSMSEAGTTVTAVLAASNATLRTGDWVVISGASPAGANGTFQITVLDNTHFTYQASAGLGTITGTILYKKAGLGWTQPNTGTNAYQFKMGNSGGYFGGSSSGHIIEVQDNGAFAGGAKEMAVRGAESSTGMGAWTGPYPTVAQQANGLCWSKSSTADATARAWTLIGDDKGFKLVMNAGSSGTTICGGEFGWFPTYKSGDLYNSLIAGSPTFNATNGTQAGFHTQISSALTTAVNGIYIARSSSQTGGAISANACMFGHGSNSNASVIGGATTGVLGYPNTPDGALWCSPLYVSDGLTTGFRGRFAGTFGPLHNVPLGLYDTSSNIAGVPGAVGLGLLVSSIGVAGSIIYDIVGPW